jgi:hypothetical protein
MAGVPAPRLPKGAVWARILRAPQQGTVRVIALTHRYAGMWTHWNGRTTYCPGPRECDCFKSGEPKCERRWRGYLPCIEYHTSRRVNLELTPAMAAQIDLWATSGIEMRGELLAVGRRGIRGGGPAYVEKVDYTPKPHRLPDWWDPTWCVLVVLGVPYSRVEEMHRREETHLVIFRADLDPERQ